MFGFLRNRPGMFGADRRAQLADDGAFYLAERVPVNRHFTGHVPGVYSGTGVARYVGAIALMPTRVLVTLPTAGDAALRAMDCPWDGTGPGRATFQSDGLHIDVELRRVHHDFSGTMSFRYKRAIPPDVLSRMPTKTVLFAVDPVLIYRAAGVRPRT